MDLFGKIREIYNQHRELAKFAMVGLSGSAFIEFLLFLFTDIHLNAVFAFILSFEIVMVSNFILHERVTFRGLNKAHSFWYRLGTYEAVSIVYRIVLAIAYFALILFGLNIFVALFLAIVLSFGVNYFLSRRMTWMSRIESKAEIVSEVYPRKEIEK